MEQLFVQLDAEIENEDYTKIIKLTNEILLRAPNDPEANKCKVVTLMKQDRYVDAITAINRIPAEKVRHSLVFEKTYSLYSLKKYAEAEEFLAKAGSRVQSDEALLAVKGQILFRVNKFDECCEVYRTLLDRTKARIAAAAASKKKKKSGNDNEEEEEEEDDENDDGDVMELNANLCAAYCEARKDELCAKLVETWHFNENSGDDESNPCATAFECGFNASCHYANAGDIPRGIEALKAAEGLYRDYLTADNDDDEEDAAATVDAALAGFTAQGGYFDAVSKRPADAEEKFARAYRNAKDVSEVKIIAANNSAALGVEKPAEALEKLTAAADNDVAAGRLSARQRAAVALTKTLLLAQLGRPHEKLREALGEYSRASGELSSETAADAEEAAELIYAIATKSTDALTAYCRAHKTNVSQKAVFTLAQLHYDVKHFAEAADALTEFLGEDFVATHRALTALVVRLRDLSGTPHSASAAAAALVRCAEANKQDVAFCGVVAAALRKRGCAEQAEHVTELTKKKKQTKKPEAEKVVVDPHQLESLAMENVARAEQLCKHLEQIPALPDTVSVEALEALPKLSPAVISSSSVKSLHSSSSSGSVSAAKSSASDDKKKKKKKNRKKRLPKNYDPQRKPDPERWLPKEQRGRYKGKKGKKSNAQKEKDSLAKGLPGARDAAMEEMLGAHDEQTESQQAAAKAAATLTPAIRQGGGGRKVNKKGKKKHN